MNPKKWYPQVAVLLKPFHVAMGDSFLLTLAGAYESIGLKDFGETIRLAHNHIITNEEEVEN